MYVKLTEVRYVHPSKYRPQVGDRVVYARLLHGERVFTIDGQPSKYDERPPTPGGILYFGNDKNTTYLAPLAWDELDAVLAYDMILPDGYPDTKTPGELNYWLERKEFSIQDDAICEVEKQP